MNDWNVEVFFDADCPLCMREIRMLRRLDKDGRIRFTDITSAAFRPEAFGKTQQEFMAKIQGRLPSGEFIEGVEVFRQLYAAVGFGPVVGLTRLPGVSGALNVAYRAFAKNRLRLTGRSDCETGACQVPETA